MRAHGRIDSAAGLGVDGHACWAVGEGEDFADAAREFLTDGMRMNQRIAYVGSESVAEQRDFLGELGDVERLIDEGVLQLFDLTDLYAIGGPIDAETQLKTYAAATDAALADGYTGLRVAAHVTDLVAEPAGWEAHVRWEGIADRYMSTRPLAALCGYDRDAVPEELLGDLAAVHPAAHAPVNVAPFRLFADGDALVLNGEVDGFSVDALDRLLGWALDDGHSTIDLSKLEFIDHHGLLALAEHAKRFAGEGDFSVRQASPSVKRLSELLKLEL